MTKKILILSTTFLLVIFISSVIFAEDNMTNEFQNSADKTGNTLQNIGNGVETAINGVVDTGEDIWSGLTNDNMNGNNQNENTNNISNNSTTNNNTMIAGTTENNTNNNTTATGITRNTGNYNATRTATDITTNSNNTLLGLNSTAWTWIIMAITAAVIISVIYYYGTQFEKTDKEQ